MTEVTMCTPILRYPEFQNAWRTSSIADLATVSSGGTPSRSKPSYWGGKIPWITTSQIKFNKIKSAEQFITEEGVANSAAKMLSEGTLLMALYGQGVTRGKVAILDFEATTNQACASIKLNHSLITTKFCFYDLQRRYQQIRDLSNDGGQKNLSGQLVKSLKVTLPTLPEQEKIAAFLTSVDDRIEQLKRKKSLLQDYKKGVMQRLFSQQLRFKDNNDNPYPDWQEKKLGDVYTYITTNSLSRDKLNYESGEVYNIHYGDIHTKFHSHFKLNKEYVPYLNDSAKMLKIKDECYLQHGDIVLADASEDYADIGKSIEVIDLNQQEVVAGLHTYILRPNLAKMSIGFGAYLMQARPTRLEVMKIAQGTKVLGLPKGYLSNINISKPHPNEQTKIANYLSNLDTKIEQVTQQITQTQTFKKGLLQQMFV